jgi:hypothetical protein
MAILNIRNLPDAVHARLRIRAAQNGRSMEAEARAILAGACQEPGTPWSPEEIWRWVDDAFGDRRPQNVTNEFIAERRREARRERERERRWRHNRTRRAIPKTKAAE